MRNPSSQTGATILGDHHVCRLGGYDQSAGREVLEVERQADVADPFSVDVPDLICWYLCIPCQWVSTSPRRAHHPDALAVEDLGSFGTDRFVDQEQRHVRSACGISERVSAFVICGIWGDSPDNETQLENSVADLSREGGEVRGHLDESMVV